MNKINFGDEVRDTVTGFQGIATSRVQYINGCVQYGVQPKVDKDGKLPDAMYVDEGRVQVVKAAADGTVQMQLVNREAGRGGPQGSSTPAGSYRG